MRELRTGTRESNCKECKHFCWSFPLIYLGKNRAGFCYVNGELLYTTSNLVCECFCERFSLVQEDKER